MTLRRAFARVLARLLAASGALRVAEHLARSYEVGRGPRGRTLRRARGGCLPILVYHRVTPRPDHFLPATGLEVFRRHVRCLSRAWEVVTLEDGLERLAAGRLSDRAVVITFDDGYLDNYTYAFPVLREHGLPATIFLATGAIGTGQLLWHDRVFAAFARTRKRQLTGFGPQRWVLDLRTPREREQGRERVLGLLRGIDDDERRTLIDQLEERLETGVPSPDGLMLDWDDVRRMAEHGFTFGAHTVSHPILSRLPAERVDREILDSKREIERQLGRSVVCFAYPHGTRADFSAATKEVLRGAGYRWAVTTLHGVNRVDPHDPFELRRIGAWEEDEAMFAVRLAAERVFA